LEALAEDAGVSVGGLVREAAVRFGARAAEELRRDRLGAVSQGRVGRSRVRAVVVAASGRVDGGGPPASPRASVRLDGLVAAREGVGIGEARRFILRGAVRVDGQVCWSFVVAEGARVEVAR
jgi:hypothetical protein